MFCQNCGKELLDDSLFCPECGAKQELEPIQKEISREEPTKKCEKCGAIIPSDSLFCPECSAKQSSSSVITQKTLFNADNSVHRSNISQQNYTIQKAVQLTPEEMEKRKKRNIIIGLSVAGLVAISVIIGVLSTVIKPSINLNKYISVSAEGYDTAGKAVIEFDSEKFENDYGKKLRAAVGEKRKSKSFAIKSGMISLDDMYVAFESSAATKDFIGYVVKGEFDKPYGLSNGDVITYEWDCDDDLALEKYGVKLKYEDIEYVVEGLEKAKTFDPFDGIEVSFSGISPNGCVEIEGTPNERAAADFYFDVDKYDGLKIGDKVVVTANIYYADDITQYCIERYGMVPSTLTKEYTVDGLDRYIRSINDVSNEGLVSMKSQAETLYYQKEAIDFGAGETLLGFDYVGNYLVTSKSLDNWWDDNYLYLVYKVTINNDYSYDGERYNKNNEFYWYTSFNNILVNSSGETIVDINSYRIPGDHFTIESGISTGLWSTMDWDYHGYQNINDLYRIAVGNYLDEYNYEDNVDIYSVPSIIPEEGDEGDDGDVSDEGKVFIYSSSQIIDQDTIRNLSDEDLRYAINEIYARNGYIFNDDTLQAYYEQFDWYMGWVKADDFSVSSFNEVERINVEAMQKERDRRK